MKFLLTGLLLILFYPSVSSSDSKKTKKIFPTPKGFTTNYKEGLVIKLQIPSYIEKELTERRRFGRFINNLELCRDGLSIKSITTKIGAATYKLLVNGGRNSYKNGVYKLNCSFSWSRLDSRLYNTGQSSLPNHPIRLLDPLYRNSMYIIDQESPSYYIKKK